MACLTFPDGPDALLGKCHVIGAWLEIRTFLSFTPYAPMVWVLSPDGPNSVPRKRGFNYQVPMAPRLPWQLRTSGKIHGDRSTTHTTNLSFEEQRIL